MSPKEDSYINTQIKKNKSTLKVQSTANQEGNALEKKYNSKKEERTRVHSYFRNGIFRDRLFEIYDNLYDVKTIQELVEEGAYKACKEIMLNRVDDLFKNQIEINPDHIANDVKSKFPYHKIPRSYERSRNFFVASICNLISKEISLLLSLNKL